MAGLGNSDVDVFALPLLANYNYLDDVQTDIRVFHLSSFPTSWRRWRNLPMRVVLQLELCYIAPLALTILNIMRKAPDTDSG